MSKNFSIKTVSLVLAAVFAFTFCASKEAKAIPAPVIITATLAALSAAGYTVLKMNPETFRGLHETLPVNTIKGPHPVPKPFETYWSENLDGKKSIWDKCNGKWLPKEAWEKIFNHGRKISCQLPEE